MEASYVKYKEVVLELQIERRYLLLDSDGCPTVKKDTASALLPVLIKVRKLRFRIKLGGNTSYSS